MKFQQLPEDKKWILRMKLQGKTWKEIQEAWETHYNIITVLPTIRSRYYRIRNAFQMEHPEELLSLWGEMDESSDRNKDSTSYLLKKGSALIQERIYGEF
jgi:hypothetical protein